MTLDEIGMAGERIFATLRDRVAADNDGRYISIDVLSGDYELGDESTEPVRRLKIRRPGSIIYTKRIGYAAVAVIGGRVKRESEPVA